MLKKNLAGGWIHEEDLESAISEIKNFIPSVLVITENQFNCYANLFHFHETISIAVADKLRTLGINRIIWAEYMPEGQFELTSEESYQKLPYEVESITLKH